MWECDDCIDFLASLKSPPSPSPCLQRWQGGQASPLRPNLDMYRSPSLNAIPFLICCSIPALLVVLSVVAGVSEACSRRSAPKPGPKNPTQSPISHLPSDSSKTSTTDPLHYLKQPCNEPWNSKFCHNGGRCFAIEIPGGYISHNCICQPRWSGLRCGERAFDQDLIVTTHPHRRSRRLFGASKTRKQTLNRGNIIQINTLTTSNRNNNNNNIAVNGPQHWIGPIATKSKQTKTWYVIYFFSSTKLSSIYLSSLFSTLTRFLTSSILQAWKILWE